MYLCAFYVNFFHTLLFFWHTSDSCFFLLRGCDDATLKSEALNGAQEVVWDLLCLGGERIVFPAVSACRVVAVAPPRAGRVPAGRLDRLEEVVEEEEVVVVEEEEEESVAVGRKRKTPFQNGAFCSFPWKRRRENLKERRNNRRER